MRSRQLNLEQYDSDKIKGGYLERYDELFDPLIDKKVVLLELGVLKGGSLLLWKDYFQQGTIVGVDLRPPKDFLPTERIHIYKGSQADKQFLSQVARETAPNGFDIIIDDASHIGHLTKVAFWHLFDNHLKPGGIYAIEDWGTGYWDDWPDGKTLDLNENNGEDNIKLFGMDITNITKRFGIKKPWHCHSYGMVGLVKQLIDEQAAKDVTRGRLSGNAKRASKFESILVVPSIVFVRKSKK